jgi:hypothetical protein
LKEGEFTEEEAAGFLKEKGFQVEKIEGDPEIFWAKEFPVQVNERMFRSDETAINWLKNNGIQKATLTRFDGSKLEWRDGLE